MSEACLRTAPTRPTAPRVVREVGYPRTLSPPADSNVQA
jgi:hypothetical protein